MTSSFLTLHVHFNQRCQVPFPLPLCPKPLTFAFSPLFNLFKTSCAPCDLISLVGPLGRLPGARLAPLVMEVFANRCCRLGNFWIVLGLNVPHLEIRPMLVNNMFYSGLYILTASPSLALHYRLMNRHPGSGLSAGQTVVRRE